MAVLRQEPFEVHVTYEVLAAVTLEPGTPAKGLDHTLHGVIATVLFVGFFPCLRNLRGRLERYLVHELPFTLRTGEVVALTYGWTYEYSSGSGCSEFVQSYIERLTFLIIVHVTAEGTMPDNLFLAVVADRVDDALTVLSASGYGFNQGKDRPLVMVP